MAELRQGCARTTAAAQPDAEARRRAIHAGRFMRTYTDAGGAWNLRMRDNPDVGARIMAAIESATGCSGTPGARAAARRRRPFAADALAELARTGDAGGGRTGRSRPKIIVRVDLEPCWGAGPSRLRGAGCSAGTWLENDHRVDWAASHLTVLDLLDRLCRHRHDLKSVEGWALVPGRGKRAFVAPDDPRHPRHCLDPPSAA